MGWPKLGLTLSGGGARGGAHVGVLLELYRLGVRPDIITGASIGGMIGGLLAAGLDIGELDDFFRHLNISNMYSRPASSHSLVGNSKIERMLEGRIGRPDFDQLPIPLALTASDLITRKLVILDQGDVISAILATIALPVLLPPVIRGEQVLIDGGVLNNTPYDIARDRGADYLIAVDLTRSAPFGTSNADAARPKKLFEKFVGLTQRHGTWQVASAVIDMVVTRNLEDKLSNSRPDVLIQPEIGTIDILDFHRWSEGVTIGRSAAQSHHQAIENLLNDMQHTRQQGTGRI